MTDEELGYIEAEAKYPLKPHKAQWLAAEVRRLRALIKECPSRVWSYIDSNKNYDGETPVTADEMRNFVEEHLK